MLLRILAGILFIAGLVILLFFRNYHGTVIPYPFLIYLGGIALVGTGVWLFRASFRSLGAREEKEIENRKAEYKRGSQLIVDLTKAEVVQNDYEKEVENRMTGVNSIDMRIMGLDSLVDETRNTKIVKVHQSVIQVEAEHNGKRYKLSSPVLNIDYATLMFKLYAQKQTTVYFRSLETRDYYIDLDFLFTQQ